MGSGPQRHPIRRIVIMIIGAVAVSALAAVIIIWFAGLTESAAWAVVAGLLAALLVSLIIGLLLRRDVFGPLLVFGLAAFFSLTWLYPGFGGVQPDPADEPLGLQRLAMIKVPVVVIKPACDYLPWSSLPGYQHAFPQAQFVMVPGAGHVAYLEQPPLYTNLVHAFLTGQELPLPTIDVNTVPDGYHGTQ